MPKDTFYFSHDYNARNDDKIKQLVRKYGMLGYGIWWAIVEDLYNNSNELQLDYAGIAFDLRIDNEGTIKSIIEDFGLFVFDAGKFGSISIQKRLDARNLKSKKARASANKRWENESAKVDNNANALRSHNDGNAIKERKEKDIKESIESKEKNAPAKVEILNSNFYRKPNIPDKEDVERNFIASGGTNEMANSFFQKYESVSWFLKGSPITNYKNLISSFITNWKKNEHRSNSKRTGAELAEAKADAYNGF